ncbi:MAG: hypothetical protein E4G95_08410 [Bacteroidia bacterium]|nr:MAG: hypothetical protein E4G95_08410 [Bacteroidia bacterium]
MAEGENNLVVGDIKQAIYRWRNSDWRIFNGLDRIFHPEMFATEVLGENWRSSKNIIRFNNFLFSTIPAILETALKLDSGAVTGIYKEVVQNDPGRHPGGYVRIENIEATDDSHQDDLVLSKVPLLIEEIQDHGYLPGDIGILVRTGNEGQKVIDSILRYAAAADQDKRDRYSYEVISQDSLLLGRNPAVKFILSTLRYITNEADKLARASMVHYYLQLSMRDANDERPDLLTGTQDEMSFIHLPDGTVEFLHSIRYLPLFEIVDRITGFFRLASAKSEIPFLTTLQDLILELSGTEANDIPLFLEWWENEGYKKSVASPEQPGAIQLMTIHKSKGLEFRVVIIPFLSWTFTHSKNPIIWVGSDDDIFNKLGAIPVAYKQEISETCFAPFYDEEKSQVAIDRLNMMYVALTRARECLFCFAPEARIKVNCGRLLLDAISGGIGDEQVGAGGGTWDASGKTFSLGEFPVIRRDGEDNPSAGIEIPYNVEVNDSRLRLRLSSHDYLSKDGLRSRERINYGLLMHELFSSIESVEDIIPGIMRLVESGRISASQGDLLGERIEKVLDNEVVTAWFSKDNEVRTESGILLKGGLLRRPDRVLINDGSATIVDFKFGEESGVHSKQLNNYRQILKEMGYVNVMAYLWYVEQGKITEVRE